MEISYSKAIFAWHTLTESQKTIINQKYELMKAIHNLGEDPKRGEKLKVFLISQEKYGGTSVRYVQKLYYEMKNNVNLIIDGNKTKQTCLERSVLTNCTCEIK